MGKRVLVAVLLILIVVVGIGFGAVYFFSSQYSVLLQEQTEAAAMNGGVTDDTDNTDELAAQAEQALRDSEANKTETTSTFESTTVDSEAWGEAAENYAVAAADATNVGTDDASLRAAQIVQEMDLTQKICQMMIVKPETLISNVLNQVIQTGNTTKNAYDKYPVGGVIYDTKNLQNADQTETMISELQDYVDQTTGYGMFICITEEGGSNVVASTKLGTTAFSSMSEIGAGGDVSEAKEVGLIQSDELTALGFNVNLAPVADVLSNDSNSVDADRSFGSDVSLVTDMVTNVIEGFTSHNMLCSPKYFPGYGSVGTSYKNGFPSTDISYEELETTDLLPFEAAIDAGVPMITVGHVIYTQLDDELPASLSPTIVNGILREELGFKGIIITDSLYTGSIATQYTSAAAAVAAIQAGCDMLLCPTSISSVVTAVTNAVENGTIAESQLDESCTRIIAAKLRYGIMGG